MAEITILLNEQLQRENERKSLKMNDNFENERNQFLLNVKKTNKMGCSQTKNERNENKRTRPSLGAPWYVLSAQCTNVH